MRWERRGRSHNLEDRRGRRPQRSGLGRGRIPMPLPRGRGGRIGIGGLLVMLAVLWLLGADPSRLLGGAGIGGGTQVGLDPGGNAFPDVGSAPPATTAAEEELVDFVSFVLDDLQETWATLLPGYRDARLVLFRGATRSACGLGRSEMGPFYCRADQKVYVDLAFYDDLRSRFGAPGDFAQAYVLAHEIGHHVQRLTGITDDVRAAQQASPARRNALSVRLELQADCLAGVWGHAAARRGILEPGDVEEGLGAAAAIGDDRTQGRSGGAVRPESFTHGSSEQRRQWLRRGLDGGDPELCDPFAGPMLLQ